MMKMVKRGLAAGLIALTAALANDNAAAALPGEGRKTAAGRTPAELAQLLRRAVTESNVGQVYRMLGLGASAALGSDDAPTPALNFAVRLGETSDALVIATALVAYGASPQTSDSNGVSAADIAIARGFGEFERLFKTVSTRGTEAFEEPPGSWALTPQASDAERGFYSNSATGRRTVAMPPACAWQYFPSHQPPFYNSVTGSAQWHTPQALSWKRLRIITEEDGLQRSVDFYWNWRTNASRSGSERAPLELQFGAGLLEIAQWFVRADTRERRFENPALTSWQKLYTSDQGGGSSTNEGRKIPYWFHPLTGESTWEEPADAAWRHVPARGSGRRAERYWNAITGEFQTAPPAAYAWRPVDAVAYVSGQRYTEIVQGIGGQLPLLHDV